MSGRRLLVALSLAILATASLRVSAQAADAWVGTWQLDVGHSTWVPGPAPYTRGTWQVERHADGQLLMIYDLVGVRGGVTHMEWIGSFDGKDYPLQGPDAPVTYAYTVVDARTIALVVKVDGAIAASARVALSPDGRTIETATTSNNARLGRVTSTSIYRKR
jgi:hypothetical protein